MDEDHVEIAAFGTAMTTMVMLVDDQLIVAERLRKDLLEDPSIDFHYCPDGHEAIATARAVRPTVILLDLLMPGIDGFRLLRELRENPPTADIPIIMLSTKEQVDCKAKAFECGANDYLIKMPDKVELIARVQYHSRAYINKLQRDAAFLALRESQRKLEQKNLELMKMSNIDGLTGVFNRRYFDTLLNQCWTRACRAHSPVSLIMIDIDYFKQFNDTYGHLAGDDCLRAVATVLREALPRSTDFVARYGGEEFAVVLDITDAAGVRLVAQRLQHSIAGLQLEHAGSPCAQRITASIGTATLIPDFQHRPEELIAAADAALYEAKKAGRHCIVDAAAPPRADVVGQ